jgi:hypothetical protein
MASIEIKRAGVGFTPIPSGNLLVDNPLDPTLQQVKDTGGNGCNLNLSTELTEVFGIGVEIAPLQIVTDVNGSGIAFKDAGTLDLDTVGIFAFADILALRAGGSAFGTVQITATFLNMLGNKIVNFIPNTDARSSSFTIDSTNEDVLCSSVVESTGALTITFDASIREGFNISVIQKDVNQTTFATTGALTLRNRLGNDKTAGQFATVTLFRGSGNDLILAGDTAS